MSEIRQRHADAYLELIKEAKPELTGPNQRQWLDRVEHEHDNLRAAMDWTIEAGATDTALRLVAAAWRFWQMRGHLHEARQRIAKALDHPDASGLEQARVSALEAGGGVAYWMSDFPSARAFYTQALTLVRQLGDRAAIANAAYNLAFVSDINETVTTALVSASGQALLRESLSLYREIGDRPGTAKVLWALASAQEETDDLAGAEEGLHESLALTRELGDQFMTGWALWELGVVAWKQYQHAVARPYVSEALSVFAAVRDLSGITLALDGLAAVAEAEGNLEPAARLMGAATALQKSSGVELVTITRRMMGREELAARTESDPRLAAA